MPELTQAQKLLIRYCKERSFSDIRTTGAASIRATDSYGKPKELSINLYGDIIDLHKRKIIAVGNTSHDITKTYELPTAWQDVRPSIRKALEEKRTPPHKAQQMDYHTHKIVQPEL